MMNQYRNNRSFNGSGRFNSRRTASVSRPSARSTSTRSTLGEVSGNQGFTAGRKPQVIVRENTVLENVQHVEQMVPVVDNIPEAEYDIDTTNMDNPLFAAEYAPEIYSYLKSQEKNLTWNPGMFETQQDVTPRMRSILVDWLVDVHHKFKLVPESLFLAINYLDRFLSRRLVRRNKLQLVGITCLFLSSKFEEIWTPVVKDFVYITDNAYTTSEVLRMERLLLKTLTFDLAAPTSFTFLRRYTRAARADRLTKYLAHYLIELAVVSERSLEFLPSKLSAAAISVALEENGHARWSDNLHHYTEYAEAELEEPRRVLKNLLSNARTSRFQAVFRKYSHDSYHRVARR
ncbi:hypothetical protein PCE1_000826 [Barthelona sp. PCE]